MSTAQLQGIRPSSAPFRPACSHKARSATVCSGSRRDTITAVALLPVLSLLPARGASAAEQSTSTTFEYMDALKDKDYGKTRMRYPDYTTTPSGLQYKDLREGSGATPKPGDTCVVDWDGYTIGYYGRPFEARNKPKGSSFAGDKDFLRFVLGKGELIPGMEEAVASMKVGGIRRIIIPVELGYPNNSKGLPDFRLQGPRPSTFAGERALDFVLGNRGGLVDKTLLIDVELINIRDS